MSQGSCSTLTGAQKNELQRLYMQRNFDGLLNVAEAMLKSARADALEQAALRLENESANMKMGTTNSDLLPEDAADVLNCAATWKSCARFVRSLKAGG